MKMWISRSKTSVKCLGGSPARPQLVYPLTCFCRDHVLVQLSVCPSPACTELLGQQIGEQVVDLWGDKVQSINLPGDHFRTKHDSIKMQLFNLALECSEVFGCFSPCTSKQGLVRIERGLQRQSMVPDFKFNLSAPLGQTASLAELKTIGLPNLPLSGCRQEMGTFGKSDRFRTTKNGTLSGQIKTLRPL